MYPKIIVTAWNNGSKNLSGAGYGIKLSIQDRDKYFDKSLKLIFLNLEGNQGQIEINVDKPSFWGINCRELISKEIGMWLYENNLAPWPKGQPPKLSLLKLGQDRFLLKK